MQVYISLLDDDYSDNMSYDTEDMVTRNTIAARKASLQRMRHTKEKNNVKNKYKNADTSKQWYDPYVRTIKQAGLFCRVKYTRYLPMMMA